MKRKTKVGILTWHDPSNCGSTLQAYALHLYLRNQGVDARIISYVPQWCRGDYMQMPLSKLSCKRQLKRLVKDGLLPFYYHLPTQVQKKINPFFPFYYHFCKMTSACTEDTIAKVCKPFTTIISGSDQVWNPCFIDPIFLQNFADNNINKISYAASLGGKKMPEELANLYKSCLSSFRAISVRENDGRDMLKSIGVNSEVHIDPTLLIDAAHYRSISRSIPHTTKPFAFCYFLPTDREYNLQVQEYIKKHNLEAVGFSANKEDYDWMHSVGNMGPLEWLWLVDNAAVVLTNSYHATIFSLIFHTPFYTFVRFTPEDPVCQNSRLEQLNSYFDIADYLIEKVIPEQPVFPFSRFEERLPALQKHAYDYLKGNIK